MSEESELDDSSDRVRRRILWSMPSGLYIVGSRADERRNAMTLNQAIQVASEPRIVALGVATQSLTAELIAQSQSFSLNLLARSDAPMVRKFVKPVAVDEEAHTMNGFPFHDGSLGLPILDQAYAYLECSVVDTKPLGDHVLVLGQVFDAAFQLDEATPILRMEDTRMKYGG